MAAWRWSALMRNPGPMDGATPIHQWPCVPDQSPNTKHDPRFNLMLQCWNDVPETRPSWEIICAALDALCSPSQPPSSTSSEQQSPATPAIVRRCSVTSPSPSEAPLQQPVAYANELSRSPASAHQTSVPPLVHSPPKQPIGSSEKMNKM